MSNIILIISIIFFFQPFLIHNFNIQDNFPLIVDILNISVYLDDKYDFFKESYNDCFYEFIDFAKDYRIFRSKYPQLVISNGKGIDDIGNEVECNKTDLYSDYLFVHLETRGGSIIKTDKGLSNYLDRNYVYLGFCVPKVCTELVEYLSRKLNDTNISIFNEYKNISVKLYELKDVKYKVTFNIIFYFFLILFLLKIILGMLVKFIYFKGYEYHGLQLYNFYNQLKKDDDDNYEKEEEILLSDANINKLNNYKNIDANLKEDYNPDYDFEIYYPMYFRLLKYFDIFNNITTFINKRNRYYNENSINILCSIKALILGYHIFTETIQILINLPNTSVFNINFYNGFGLSFYKRSINSLTFWVILESATFSFKIMKYIKKKYNNKEKNITKREKLVLIIKQILKFFCFYIPKIISYIFIFIFFYYLFGHYTCKFQAKMTYYYISKEIINTKQCQNDLWKAFIPFFNYKKTFIEEYDKICHPFVYVYSNMFFISLFFMFILFIIFYFQKIFIDIIITIIIFLNLIGSYIYLYIKNFDKNENKQYKFSHFSGENYSIFYPHIFLGYYYLGFLLGLCIYYYSEYINNLDNLNKTLKEKNTNSNEKRSRTKSIFSKSNSFSSIDEEDEDEDIYKPMKFCKILIIKLKKVKNLVKIILIFIYFAISIFLSVIVLLTFKEKKNENTIYSIIMDKDKYFYILNFLYFFEKLINAFLFFFFICLILVLPQRYSIIKFMKSLFFIPISRAGFFMTCTYQSLIYILYCLFQLKVKMGFLVIFYIMIGFYTIIVFFCILATIFIELPFRILIKNLLNDDSNDIREEFLISMKSL